LFVRNCLPSVCNLLCTYIFPINFSQYCLIRYYDCFIAMIFNCSIPTIKWHLYSVRCSLMCFEWKIYDFSVEHNLNRSVRRCMVSTQYDLSVQRYKEIYITEQVIGHVHPVNRFFVPPNSFQKLPCCVLELFMWQ